MVELTYQQLFVYLAIAFIIGGEVTEPAQRFLGWLELKRKARKESRLSTATK